MGYPQIIHFNSFSSINHEFWGYPILGNRQIGFFSKKKNIQFGDTPIDGFTSMCWISSHHISWPPCIPICVGYIDHLLKVRFLVGSNSWTSLMLRDIPSCFLFHMFIVSLYLKYILIMCVFAYVYIYIYIYPYMYVYIYMYIIYIYTYIYICHHPSPLHPDGFL